eukprot:8635488-Pyramimonas_sp.AAC.1
MQCGGLPGRGLEGAILFVRQFWSTAKACSLSPGEILLDLHAALYSALKQLCLSLPAWQDRLEDALHHVEVPPFLRAGLE